MPGEDEAPIVHLVDVTSGQVLYSRNADRRFIPASMTKVMTVFLAFELIEEGKLSPAQVMTIREDTWREWAQKGSTMFLPADARVRVGDLIGGIANISANDGSIMLAEGYAGSVEAWVDAMNAKARELGLSNTHYGTPNGWPDEGRTFTSAADLVRLGQAMVERHPDKFARYVGRPEYTFNNITQPNRDPMIGRVAGADGIKTGFTNEAGFGFLGTANRNGQRLMFVIAGVDRNALRARLSRQLIEWGFSNFDRRRIFARGAVVGEARVQGGASRSIPLVADRNVYVNVPTNATGPISASIVYDGPVRAPISSGVEIAHLRISVPGMDPAIVPLVAGKDVDQAGFLGRIWNGVAGWFG
ncbi:D-alanyl-D-alanine carboxypeptidase DacA precursor [Erythrobacter sp. THAF29]|nr:D-alanyl-D-alanine carboxypeptidase DacA precursor [Erythrobacter sp. THAF29]